MATLSRSRSLRASALLCALLSLIAWPAWAQPVSSGVEYDVLGPSAQPMPAPLYPLPTREETIMATEGVTLTGPSGVRAVILPGAFTFADGSRVTGDVRVVMTEVVKPADILAAGLSTSSEGRLLVSGGMVRLEAWSEGKPLQLAEGQRIALTFPDGNVPGMQLFEGVVTPTGAMDWRPMTAAAEPTATATAMSVDTAAAMARARLRSQLLGDFGRVNPRTFSYPQTKSTIQDVLTTQLRNCYPCSGRDRIYIEVCIGEQGYPVAAKALTGARDCYKRALEELGMMMRWDPETVGKRFYFEVMPSIAANSSKPDRFVSMADNPSLSLTNEQREAIRMAGEMGSLPQARTFQPTDGKRMGETEEMMSTLKLGWINCDRFYDVKKTVDCQVALGQPGKPECAAFLVFQDMRSVMPGQRDAQGGFTFSKIPEGLAATVVVLDVKAQEERYAMAMQAVTTRGGRVATLELQPMQAEQLIARLQDL